MRQFAKWTLFYAFLIFVAVQCLYGFLFLLSHLPPSVVHLDSFLRVLAAFARFFTWPRRLLRALWPAESTPTALNYSLAIINWLFWGSLAATWKTLRTRGVS